MRPTSGLSTGARTRSAMEIHGTTKRKPYPAFLAEEQAASECAACPPFERPLWKECTVHPDHHIVFEKSYYSLPTRYIGKKVWAKGTQKMVEFFLDHERDQGPSPLAYRPGTMGDGPDRLPAGETRLPHGDAHVVQEEGSRVRSPYGSAHHRDPQRARHEEPPQSPGDLTSRREVLGDCIEKVAERALLFGNTRYRSIKTMLENGIDRDSRRHDRRCRISGQRFLRAPATSAGRCAMIDHHLMAQLRKLKLGGFTETPRAQGHPGRKG